ncbi:Hypothetical protein, partial CDS, partial [Neorhizobium galegae bv. officinalis]
MSDEISKTVTESWTWFTDYVGGKGDWTVHCPSDRKCQVGMGVKAFGEPRGEKLSFQGTTRFTAFGLGAIHVKVIDGKGSCTVRLDEGHVDPVTIFKM